MKHTLQYNLRMVVYAFTASAFLTGLCAATIYYGTLGLSYILFYFLR